MGQRHYIGHRKRLRERFRDTGFVGFRDYETLELLLTFALPRKDTKPLAKKLISQFGNLRGVIDATFEELVAVEGIGENTATFIGTLRELSAIYLREGVIRNGRQNINSTGALIDYCTVAMSGLRNEQFRAIFLNSQNEIITDEAIHEGTVNQSVVYPRKVMERALHHNATAIIFVHNHPGGSCKPSQEDKALTAELVKVARGLGINVHDHLIICRAGYFSFLERGLL